MRGTPRLPRGERSRATHEHLITINREAVNPMTLLTLFTREWTRFARCTPADIDRLDPIVGGHPSDDELAVRTQAAEELCAHCPVAQTCAQDADLDVGVDLDLGPAVGVRGGSLRYRAGGPRGEYTVVPLIPEAVPSVHGPAVHEHAIEPVAV